MKTFCKLTAQSPAASYVPLPRFLLQDETLRAISNDAKVLYALLLDRASISRQNGYVEPDGTIRLYFTLEQAQAKLHRSRQSATRIFRELEYSGLIVRRKQGLGKPALITLNYPSDAKLIAKVNKIAFDDVIDSFGIDSIIYPKYLTADYILQYVRARQNTIGCNVETLYKILDGRAEALEFSIKEDSAVTNVPLMDLNLKDNLLICCINRNGQILTPRGQNIIKVGDTVILVTTNRGLGDIRDILKS